MRYILASQSPRRRELLARTGLEFEVIPSDVERKDYKRNPVRCCHGTGTPKSGKCLRKNYRSDDYTVIGSDTIVVYRDEILGKPV